jgi:hypothetical protein
MAIGDGVVALLLDIKTSLLSQVAQLAVLVDGQYPVVAGYKYQKAKLTFTATGAYTINDVVGILVELPNFATAIGRAGRITEMRVVCSKKTCLPQFEVHFFKSVPATWSADNAAYDARFADEDARAGFVTMSPLVAPSGAATIDYSRIQHNDNGDALSKDICTTTTTSLWVGLKLINTPAVAFDAGGNTISVHIGWEKS